MKVGDLVQLSAYGRVRKRAKWISPDDVGIITKVVAYNGGYQDEFVVQWVKSVMKGGYSWEHERQNHRKDLKYVKKKK